MTRELKVLDHTPTMTLGTDRLNLHPWGLKGGKAGGTVGSRIVTPEKEEIPLPSKTTREVAPGSCIILQTAGAGGYGPPYQRDPERIREDVIQGFISETRAKEAYGVILDGETHEIDKISTLAIRKQMAQNTTHD